jgi:hypothetical protein
MNRIAVPNKKLAGVGARHRPAFGEFAGVPWGREGSPN